MAICSGNLAEARTLTRMQKDLHLHQQQLQLTLHLNLQLNLNLYLNVHLNLPRLLQSTMMSRCLEGRCLSYCRTRKTATCLCSTP